MKRPTLFQQAVAGVAVLFVIGVTLTGGVILAASDSPGALGLVTRRTATATPYQISTLPPDTATSTRSMAPGATPLATATPAPTNTLFPTSTATATNTPLPSATPCYVRLDWAIYTVQQGDTLSGLAARYGIASEMLMGANCMTTTTLYAGQRIVVPSVTPIMPAPTDTTEPSTSIPVASSPTPGPSPTPSGSEGICTNVNSVITHPPVGAVLTGYVSFYGTATHEDFSFYKLELRQEGGTGPADWVTFYTGYEPVVNDWLGELRTDAFSDGEYWVRLVVVDNHSGYPERCSKLYVIEN